MNKILTIPIMMRSVQVFMFLFTLYSVIMAFAERKKAKGIKNICWMGPGPAAVIFVPSAFLTGFSFSGQYGWRLSLGLSVLFLYCVCTLANMQVQWDTNGFIYRTAMRRRVRYAFSDIRRVKIIRYRFGSDLLMRVGRRMILLDYMMGLPRFLSEYDNWRTRNGFDTVWEEREKRWMEKYLRHGPFRRKLDRISGGRTALVLSLILGPFLAVIGIFGLLTVRPTSPRDVFALVCSGAFALLGIIFPILYLYGVIRMDRKILRFYISGTIRPDPEEPKKQKQ